MSILPTGDLPGASSSAPANDFNQLMSLDVLYSGYSICAAGIGGLAEGDELMRLLNVVSLQVQSSGFLLARHPIDNIRVL
ncbi:hypothetical protein RRF57_012110 [Xylaria bambusicola]|uniref:Uncharacterized protein n=1 Tax=Xylaria bambusicola TaxID=326684 RepID=A0AAN7ZEJ2_9PEZI